MPAKVYFRESPLVRAILGLRLWLARRFVRLARLSVTIAEPFSPELFPDQ